MTSKEYIEEHLNQLKKDFDIAIKENLKEYANKLVEDIKQSEAILKDLKILEEIRNDFKVLDWGEDFQNRYELVYHDRYKRFINKIEYDRWSRWLDD